MNEIFQDSEAMIRVESMDETSFIHDFSHIDAGMDTNSVIDTREAG